MEKVEDNEISYEVQDIIGRSPNWLLRVGATIIFILLISVLASSFFISYPEKIVAEATITTTIPPIRLVANIDGEIDSLLVRNGQTVRKGQAVALFYSGARYADILLLKRALRQKSSDQLKMIELFQLDFGELSTAALNYLQSQNELARHRQFTVVNEQERTIQSKVKDYNSLADHQREQYRFAERELELAEKDFRRNKRLHENKVLSDQEFELKEQALLAVRKSKTTLAQAIDLTRIEIANLQLLLKETRINYEQQLLELRQTVEHSRKLLEASVLAWEEKFVLISNINGKITFIDHWGAGQYVARGQALFSVEPDFDNIVAKLKVPAINSGKIQVGQEVQIKLDNFPFEQYGMLTGKVRLMTTLPNEKLYQIDVEFDNGLMTSYGNRLDLHAHMSGTASIITEDVTIFNRLFFNLRKLSKSN